MPNARQRVRQELESSGLKITARAMRQVKRKKDAVPLKMIAYDFETSRIKEGTPRPLYITAYSECIPMHYASRIDSMEHLQQILKNNFITQENLGATFVGWNANNFDAYFVAAALVTCEEYCIVPYLTKSNSLRGMRIIKREDINNKKAKGWQFLDGISMLGLAGTPLSDFTKNFAPKHQKLSGVIDWEKEEFDPDNPKHCEYAMVDSIGLYHGMKKAQDIFIEHFNAPLGVTMGGACIKIFKSNIPESVVVQPCSEALLSVIRSYVMRGGYCHCVKRYQGPVWKYDLNQAYAAAMREARLPAGGFFNTKGKVHTAAIVFIVRITGTNPNNKIPFYCRQADSKGRIRSVFCMKEIEDTWITSIEYNQLKSEGWKITIIESYTWESSFKMKDYVDRLERGRIHADGGPKGPIGTMYKAVGNHSYGKTVEILEPLEFVLASDCPPDYVPYYKEDDAAPVDFVFYRFLLEDEINPKDYHHPQIGSFITAHVRMVVRRAALLAPDDWIYADTDCVVFTSDVTDKLDTDPARYGAWKIEEQGEIYQIITKKVYTKYGAERGHAKGLNVKKLTPKDYEEWYNGTPPEQTQVQRNNFLTVLKGTDMYRTQVRKGTSV